MNTTSTRPADSRIAPREPNPLASGFNVSRKHPRLAAAAHRDSPRKAWLKLLALPLLLAAALPAAAQEASAEKLDEAARDVAAGPEAGWTTERGGSLSQGKSPSPMPQAPRELWSYEVDGGAFDATPVIVDGQVFVCDADGETHCLNLADGKPIWKHESESGYIAAAAVQGDRVIVCNYDGEVLCLSRSDGSELWKFKTEAQIDSGATFYQGAALVTSEDGNLYCLSLEDGSLRWKYETGDQLRCSAAVAGDVTFLGGCDSVLHIVDLQTGKAIENDLPLGSPTGSTPAVAPRAAVVPTHAGTILAFDWREAKELWRFEDTDLTQEIRTSPALGDSLVYITPRNKRVLALDAASGEVRWEHVLRKRADSSPAFADGRVWVAAADGQILALDAASGEVRWREQRTGSFTASPAIADGKLLVASTKGVVYCFGE